MTIDTTYTVYIPMAEVKVILALAVEQHLGKKFCVDSMYASYDGDRLVCNCSPREQELHMPTTDAAQS